MQSFSCENCGKTLSNLSNYKKHLRTKRHLEIVQGTREKERKYTCEPCGYETRVKCNYESHMLTTRHKRNFKEKNPLPEGFCECCSCDLGCFSKLQRHQQTKNHKILFEKYFSLPKEKLENLEKLLLCYLLAGDGPAFVETSKNGSRVLMPAGMPTNSFFPGYFFRWLRNITRKIGPSFSEDGDILHVSWASHTYKISKRNFLYLVVSLSEKVYKFRVKETLAEFERRREANGLFDLQLYLEDANSPLHEEEMIRHKNIAREESYKTVVYSWGFWDWWVNGEEKFSKSYEQCMKSSIVEGATPLNAKNTKDMKVETYISVLSDFTGIYKEQQSREILCLVLLDKVSDALSPSKNVSNSVMTYVSFGRRTSHVKRNVFLSFFGMEKLSALSERVLSVSHKVWERE
ncbi:zinc finger protein [Marseillevirus marseillevirus]|uniref:Zinc finger protein n=1 Tax=Marseillevirus marseillevirus TaxID=694581 RepID=D2XA78_GBMV|nr:zinc finger protein [Marseillevirus marseillevirus]ADB03855.1 zinc finger protein [Marseillevirus marseillevirus]